MYIKIFLIAVFIVLVLGGTLVLFNRSSFREASESVIEPTESLEPTQPPHAVPFEIKGSIPYWDQDRAFSSFKEHMKSFDYINLFWYYLGDDGQIEKYRATLEDKNIIDFAHVNKVKVLAVITNLPDKKGATWDSDLVESVIKDKASRDIHISNIIKKIEEFNFDGVAIDYEEVTESQKENFSSFVKELSDSLRKNGKIVAVALHPKTNNPDSENGAFQDWETLAKYADHLNIMAYGEHWDEGSAGPIASAPWVEKIIRYTKNLDIPSKKFFLGIPLYGYDWNKDHEDAGEGLTYEDVRNLLIKFGKEEQWDTKSSSPYFFYEVEGDTHEVWFENSKSVMDKIELAKKANFAGVTFWRLGGEDQKIWEAVDYLR